MAGVSVFKLDVSGAEELQQSIKSFSGNAEATINDVLHNEASPLIQNEIRRLMPESNRKPWTTKKAAAKGAKSLMDKKENLSITVKTTADYNYLYFPDDGSNTRKHAGNQQFFRRGGENVQAEIISRCLRRLTSNI